MRVFKRGMLVETSVKRLLYEAEEDDLFGGGEEGGEEDAEEGGDKEAGGEEGGEEAEDDGKKEEEEEPKTPPIKPGDKAQLEKQFDAKLDTMLQDFEVSALKSAKINAQDPVKTENWWRAPVSKLLYEAEKEYTESDFDIQKFASDVARLIMNYDTLLDMESTIYNKAKSFLDLKYGKDVADSMSEILATRYGLDFEGVKEPTPDYLAIGARSGGGAA